MEVRLELDHIFCMVDDWSRHHAGSSTTAGCSTGDPCTRGKERAIHTAVPGSEDETKLKLTRVSGTHVMSTHET